IDTAQMAAFIDPGQHDADAVVALLLGSVLNDGPRGPANVGGRAGPQACVLVGHLGRLALSGHIFPGYPERSSSELLERVCHGASPHRRMASAKVAMAALGGNSVNSHTSLLLMLAPRTGLCVLGSRIVRELREPLGGGVRCNQRATPQFLAA